MEDVKFLPWEGENYQKGGFNGKKILVIGESFYCSEEEAVATLTTKIVEEYLGKGKKVSDCTSEQAAQLDLIVFDLKKL